MFGLTLMKRLLLGRYGTEAVEILQVCSPTKIDFMRYIIKMIHAKEPLRAILTKKNLCSFLLIT